MIAKRVPAETFQELQTEMKAAGLLGLTRAVAPTGAIPTGTLAANLIGWVNEQGGAT